MTNTHKLLILSIALSACVSAQAEAPGGPQIDDEIRIAHCGEVSKSWIVSQGLLPSIMPPLSSQQEYLDKIGKAACEHGLQFGAWTEATDFPGPDGDNTGFVGGKGLQITNGYGDCNLYTEYLVDGIPMLYPTNAGSPSLYPVCADLFNMTTDSNGNIIFTGGVTVPITSVKYACMERRVWGGGNNPEPSVSCDPMDNLYPGDYQPEIEWNGMSDDDTSNGSSGGGVIQARRNR